MVLSEGIIETLLPPPGLSFGRGGILYDTSGHRKLNELDQTPVSFKTMPDRVVRDEIYATTFDVLRNKIVVVYIPRACIHGAI